MPITSKSDSPVGRSQDARPSRNLGICTIQPTGRTPSSPSSSGSSSIFDVTSQTNLPLISTLAMQLTASLE